MRRLILEDLTTLARALLAASEDEAAAVARAILMQAEYADRFRKRLGRRHPLWGDGTLAAAARMWKCVPPSGMTDADFRAALCLALTAIEAHKAPRAKKGFRLRLPHSHSECAASRV